MIKILCIWPMVQQTSDQSIMLYIERKIPNYSYIDPVVMVTDV